MARAFLGVFVACIALTVTGAIPIRTAFLVLGITLCFYGTALMLNLGHSRDRGLTVLDLIAGSVSWAIADSRSVRGWRDR